MVEGSNIRMRAIFGVILTAAIAFLAGCATKNMPETSRLSAGKQGEVVPVVAQAKYLLSDGPPWLVWGEVYGDETALGISGITNVNGVVFEIVEPAEFAGKIYTLRNPRFSYLTNNPFVIGEMYEFQASVRNIGKFSFEQSTAIPARKLTPAETKKRLETSRAPRLDDLEWLVGRWRCITREWLIAQDGPLGSACEDALDYFNVYFPYADDHLTLRLTDNPNDRPIAAEFLARYIRSVWAKDPFEERLGPMMEPGPVRISKDHIWVGYPFGTVEFRYYRREGRWGPLLVLETKFMRLEFYKLHAAMGDIKRSFVHAPIRDYSPEHISELKERYAQMCAPLNNKLKKE
jgi:hypothetical protein